MIFPYPTNKNVTTPEHFAARVALGMPDVLYVHFVSGDGACLRVVEALERANESFIVALRTPYGRSVEDRVGIHGKCLRSEFGSLRVSPGTLVVLPSADALPPCDEVPLRAFIATNPTAKFVLLSTKPEPPSIRDIEAVIGKPPYTMESFCATFVRTP